MREEEVFTRDVNPPHIGRTTLRDELGTRGGSGVRRNHQQTGNGERRDWSGHGVRSDEKPPVSMNTVQALTALGLESAQRGTTSRKRKQDTRLSLHPFAVRRPKGTWHAIQGVTGPRDAIRREALALLLAGFLDTPTPTPEEITLARAAQERAEGATLRGIETPPEGVAAVTGPSPNATPQRHPTAARGL